MSFEAAYRDEDLPRGSEQVHLRGLRGVQWPPYCVKCGAPTSLRMTIAKVFRRRITGSDSVRDDPKVWQTSPWHYVIRKFRIPFCAACIRKQDEIREHVSTARVVRSLLLTPLIIPFAFALFFAVKGYGPLVTGTVDNAGHAVAVGIYALFIFTMAIIAFASWRAARFNFIPPTTEITRACQMSDRLGWYDIGFHRIYAFENAGYASAFKDLNRERVWTDRDQKTMRRRQAISMTVIFASVAAAFVWLYVLGHKQ